MRENKIVALGLSVFTAFAGIGMLLGESKALSANAEEGIMPLACDTVLEPELDLDSSEIHHCVYAYAIYQNEPHADTVYFKKTANDQYDQFSISVAYNKIGYYYVPSSTSSQTCTPTYQVMRSKCAVEGIYSAYNQDLRNTANYRSARYPITNKTGSLSTVTSSGLSWSYSASANDNVYFSLVYNNEVEDGALNIKPIASNSMSMTLGGVTFKIKVTKSSLVLTASEVVTFDNSSAIFAFYLDT